MAIKKKATRRKKSTVEHFGINVMRGENGVAIQGFDHLSGHPGGEQLLVATNNWDALTAITEKAAKFLGIKNVELAVKGPIAKPVIKKAAKKVNAKTKKKTIRKTRKPDTAFGGNLKI